MKNELEEITPRRTWQDVYGVWLVCRQTLNDEIGFEDRKEQEKHLSDLEKEMQEDHPEMYTKVFAIRMI